jgi:hypothetical protein
VPALGQAFVDHLARRIGRMTTKIDGAKRNAVVGLEQEDAMPDNLSKQGQPDRSKIAMNEAFDVRYWIKHLGVSKKELQRAVDKVGNSAATVKKELEK